jgi:hypothetical protein
MTSNVTATAAVQPTEALGQIELERALLYLEQTRVLIVGAIRNVSELQWYFKPSPDRWSIAEIVEHIIVVQERVLGPAREQLENSPRTPVHPDYKLVDYMIIYQIPSRLTKFPSPLQPAGGVSRSDALERLLANYTALNRRLETTPDLRNHSIESAPIKAISNGAYASMDGYQWILAAAAHTERHTKQVLEVIADPGFPA